MSDVWRKYFYTQDLFKTISNPIMFPWILAVGEYSKCSWTGSDGIWAKIIQKADHIWFLPYRVLTIHIKESIEFWGVPKDLSDLWDGCPECLWRTQMQHSWFCNDSKQPILAVANSATMETTHGGKDRSSSVLRIVLFHGLLFDWTVFFQSFQL